MDVGSKKLKNKEQDKHSTIGICIFTSKDKNAQKLCRFSVVPGNGPAILGMPDSDLLDILTINWNTIQVGWQVKLIKDQKVEEQNYTNNNSNSISNPVLAICNNSHIDYLLPGPNVETDRLRAKIELIHE